MPLIDHPALAPLVQDYLQARQQQQQQAGGGGGTQPQSTTTTTATTDNTANGDDDEFDDFVSVTVPANTSPQVAPFPASSLPPPPSQGTPAFMPTFPTPAPTTEQPPGASVWPQTAPGGPKSAPTQALDKNKAMNLPKLGFSPEPSPTTSFDDEFDEFQSAALPCIPQAGSGGVGQQPKGGQAIPTAASTVSTEQPPPVSLLQPEKPGKPVDEDKYAVFREIATGMNAEPADETENPDDSFGEFCSSEVASLSLTQNASSSSSTSAPPGLLQCQSASGTSNTSPISFEVYSTPPEALPDAQTDAFEADFSAAFASSAAPATSTRPPDNYADIHEAMKRAEAEQKRKEEAKWSDPFGEFEEAPPPLPPPSVTTSAAAGSASAMFGGVPSVPGAIAAPLHSAATLTVPWVSVCVCLFVCLLRFVR